MATGTGKNYKLFTQSDGVGGSAGWNEVTSCVSCNAKVNQETAEASKRGDFKGYRPGQVDFGLSVVCRFDPTDTYLEAIIAAASSGATIGVAALDGSSAAGEGPVFDAIVSNLEQNQDPNNVVNITFDLMPDADSAVDPTWTTSGA